MSIQEAVAEIVRAELALKVPEIVAEVEARVSRNADLDRYVNTEAAANILGKTTKTLERWRATGNGPAFERTGTRKGVSYKVRNLHEYMNRKRRQNNQDLHS